MFPSSESLSLQCCTPHTPHPHRSPLHPTQTSRVDAPRSAHCRPSTCLHHDCQSCDGVAAPASPSITCHNPPGPPQSVMERLHQQPEPRAAQLVRQRVHAGAAAVDKPWQPASGDTSLAWCFHRGRSSDLTAEKVCSAGATTLRRCCALRSTVLQHSAALASSLQRTISLGSHMWLSAQPVSHRRSPPRCASSLHRTAPRCTALHRNAQPHE